MLVAVSAKPYLQQVSMQLDAETDTEVYPFNIPSVREMCCLEFHGVFVELIRFPAPFQKLA